MKKEKVREERVSKWNKYEPVLLAEEVVFAKWPVKTNTGIKWLKKVKKIQERVVDDSLASLLIQAATNFNEAMFKKRTRYEDLS